MISSKPNLCNKNGRKKARTKIVRAVYIHKIYNDLESGDAVQPVIDAGADAKEGYAEIAYAKHDYDSCCQSCHHSL